MLGFLSLATFCFSLCFRDFLADGVRFDFFCGFPLRFVLVALWLDLLRSQQNSKFFSLCVGCARYLFEAAGESFLVSLVPPLLNLCTSQNLPM